MKSTDETKEIEESYSNGVLKTSGETVNGLRQGRWYSYYPNGYLKTIENYEKGLLHGTQRRYNKKFEVIEKQEYIMGKLIES